MLLILVAVAMNAMGENGTINKAHRAGNQTQLQYARESLIYKIELVEMDYLGRELRNPTLQELADALCADNDIESVQLSSDAIAAINTPITVGNASHIYVKLEDYSYEFKINTSLKIEDIVDLANPDEDIDPEGNSSGSGGSGSGTGK